jgi:hypothetical protein
MFNLKRCLPQRPDRRRVVDLRKDRQDGGRGEEDEFAVWLEEGTEGCGEVAICDLEQSSSAAIQAMFPSCNAHLVQEGRICNGDVDRPS